MFAIAVEYFIINLRIRRQLFKNNKTIFLRMICDPHGLISLSGWPIAFNALFTNTTTRSEIAKICLNRRPISPSKLSKNGLKLFTKKCTKNYGQSLRYFRNDKSWRLINELQYLTAEESVCLML